MEMSPKAELSRIERLALRLGRAANETALGKQVQQAFLLSASYGWIYPAMARRMYVDNVDYLIDRPPAPSLVMAANHRTFFDAYLYMLALYARGARWPKRLFFPVRANFFYETTLGMAVNFAVGGGVMYPPIFRDKNKADLNRDALDRIARFLDEPGTIVGVHPEGKRNKGDDAYALLPAQPGIGQIVLQAKATVIPVFINGVSNEFFGTIRDSFRPNARRDSPCIVVFGEPVDLSDFADKKPRAALYKQSSDRILAAVAACGEREREIRAACARGDIGDDDPGWLTKKGQQHGAR